MARVRSHGQLSDQSLTAASVELDVRDPQHPQALHCLRGYFAELEQRFDGGFDASGPLLADPETMRPPRGVFVVATLSDEPLGCGAVLFHPGGVAEVKRLWVSPTARGLGLGARLMRDLERRAQDQGCTRVRLDTNASLTEAIAMYRRLGYHEVAPFTHEPYIDFWFEKLLSPDPEQSR